MSKKKNQQKRKKARHDRRVANRAKLKKPALKLYVAPTDNLPAVQTPTAPAVMRLRTTLLLQSPMIVPPRPHGTSRPSDVGSAAEPYQPLPAV